MDAFNGYKTMSELHKNNIKSYYIYDGIYTAFPDIDDKDAKFIHNICCNIDTGDISPFSISHYLTDHYTRGLLTKEELKNATSGEIRDAVYFDNLSYFNLERDDIEEEI